MVKQGYGSFADTNKASPLALAISDALFRHKSVIYGPLGGHHMSNARKLLIVDDDAELRDTLVEQLGAA